MEPVRIGIAPVKGLRHLSMILARVDAEGLVGDRACALVDPSAMATLKSAENGRLVQAVGRVQHDGVITVELPGGAWYAQTLDGGDEARITYWGRPVRARLVDGEVAAALSDWLGRRVLLAPAPQRRSFVWDAPVSVVTMPELRVLADRLGRPELLDDLGRYRSNLVLDADLRVGDRFRIGEVLLEAVGEIERCAVMDQHPLTGERDIPVLKELARYRRGPDGIALGLRCRVLEPGTVAIGRGEALSRELRHQAALAEAEVLRRRGPADDLDELVEWSAHRFTP